MTEPREHVHREHRHSRMDDSCTPDCRDCPDCRAREATIAAFDKTFTAMNAHILALDARLTESEYARDSLRLERDALEHMRIRGNEELIRQRDEARAAATRAQGVVEAARTLADATTALVERSNIVDGLIHTRNLCGARADDCKVLNAIEAVEVFRALDADRILDHADTRVLSEIREVSGALDEAVGEIEQRHETCGCMIGKCVHIGEGV